MGIYFKRIYSPRQSTSTCVIILVGILIVIHFRGNSITNNLLAKRYDEEYGCHSREDDVLQSVSDIVFLPPRKSIFFIEESCRGALDLFQSCAVESAARANPGWQVNVLFSSPVSQSNFRNGPSKLLKLSNVKVMRINIDELIKGTPLNDISIKQDAPTYNISDVLKYIIMYKYSGVYLDLNALVARSFDELRSNWVVKEGPATISNRMFAFSENDIGRQLSQIAISLLSSKFMSDETQASSNEKHNILGRLVMLWCTTQNISLTSSNNCHDLAVYHAEQFYTIPFEKREDYYKPLEGPGWETGHAFVYFLWDHHTRDQARNDSFFSKLAGKYCPMTYTNTLLKIDDLNSD